ncbi:zinc-dependent peptidase [Pedobacter frigiditerrae]|uniref:Zinc-dependent peptidase n=1 Tax=Pedobacter frigiditerrae TaxID=2530452 RepID=A0A4R0MTI8_9SPHI|nr:M90 family metallopeptidase [Pedobacter frigiditerrae]TCC90391.1 zinc-dependent peptidase [Pedobacter frigiditerrae]
MNYTPYLILVVAFIVALYFIFRKKKLVVVSLSEADKQLLASNVDFYIRLDGNKKELFEQKVADFLVTTKIEGVGLEITQLDRLLVAASAVIPIFSFTDWKYKNLSNVVLYPDTFNQDFQFEDGERNIMGMVGTGFMNGQMILSLAALRHGFSKSAGMENTGIHEFVHLLDKSDGATDGVPENLMAHEYTLPWLKMMHEEIERIKEDKSDINPYAITNQAEFFAVVSEYFFEQPEILKDKHPELYLILSKTFGQNLAEE